jgi:hypothetical protein
MGLSDTGGFRPRRSPRLPGHIAVIMMFVSAWILPGCGVVTGTSQPSAAGVATIAPTATGAKINGAMPNACPVAQAPDEASSFTPDIIVSEDGAPSHTLTLHPSQRLEIRLDSQIQWQLRIVDPQHILVSAISQGWHDTTSSTCVWRFTTQGAGDAQLVFSGTLPCPPLKFCPSSDRLSTYRLSIG